MSTGKRDYIDQRNKELIRAFYSLLGSGIQVSAAIARAAMSPCSRFWISSETAQKCVAAMAAGRYLPDNGSSWCKRKMIKEIYRRCAGDYSRANIEKIVYGGAPHFYLTQKSAKVTIYNELKRRRKCKRKGI